MRFRTLHIAVAVVVVLKTPLVFDFRPRPVEAQYEESYCRVARRSKGRAPARPAATVGLSMEMRIPGVRRQLLLPVDDHCFCRFRSSWIENQQP